MIHANSLQPFLEGVRTALPFLLPIGLIYMGFGAACTGQGFGLGEALTMSALIYSTPLQLLLLEMADEPLFGVLHLVLATNARFALLASTLAPALRTVPLSGLISGATLLIPTVFLAMRARLAWRQDGAFAFFVGVGLPLYVVTQIATGAGALVGRSVASPIVLDASRFAMALFLVLMAARLWPSHRLVSAFALGALAAPVVLPHLGVWAMVGVPLVIGLGFSFRPRQWAR